MRLASTILLMAGTMVAALGLACWLGIRMERLLDSDDNTYDDLQRRRAFAWNISGRSFIEASWFMFGYTVYRFRAEDLGAPVWFTPIFLGMMVLAYGVGSFIWGAIADKIGRRKQLLLIGTLALVFSMALMPFLSLIPFVIVVFMQILMAGCVRISFALASEWTADHSGEAIGMMHATGWMLAVAVGVLAGSIYDIYGMGAVAIIGCSLYAIAGVCYQQMTGDEVEEIKSSHFEDEESSGEGFDPIAATKALLTFQSRWPLLILGVVLLITIPRGAIVLTSLNYIEKIGFDLDLVFIFEAWALALNVVLFTYAGVICDRIGAQKVLTAAAFGYFVLWSLFAIGMPAAIAVAIYLIPVVGLLYTSSDALLARHTTLEERNRGIGISAAALFVGQFIGSASAGGIMAALNHLPEVDRYLWSYRIMAPILGIATFLGWRLVRAMQKDGEVGTLDAVLEAEIV